jgi:hypothetical protein
MSRIAVASGEQSDTRLQPAEVAARRALDLLARRTLTNAEWSRARAKLLEFISILRAWDRQPSTAESW